MIGRRQQIQELNDALASAKPEMVALVGRRRVGKTYLVRQVYGDRIDFELTGVQHGNMNTQLQNFGFSMGKYFPDFRLKDKPTSWLEAFHWLGQALEMLGKREKFVVFLDELPWLGSRRSGFVAGLGYFWNSWASRQNIVVVICGSAASWMIKKVINDKGGLHNRVTKLLFLYPFTLAETEQYCQARQIRLDRFHLLQIYMVMGGVPMYLDQLKSGFSAMQNIAAICFAQEGYLRNEFERLFASLFDNHTQHVAVVRALASRRNGMTRQEIINATHFSNGGMLSEILDELSTSGFVTIYNGYGKKVKESLYRLTDFYTHFYLTFIEPLGKHSKIEFTQLSDLPKWKTWSGYAYENICLTHIDPIRRALGISGMATSVASFVAAPKDGLPGAQIDLLIDRNDQTINLCEIKFSTSEYALTKQDTDDFARKKSVFRYHTQTNKHLFLTLITTFGAINNSHKINHVDQVLTKDHLFLE
ncbi:MAG: ATP-binding protein [Saprospiraceae bacterium]|nr:ATP-binding protein [Saprospiraceae bacterium]